MTVEQEVNPVLPECHRHAWKLSPAPKVSRLRLRVDSTNLILKLWDMKKTRKQKETRDMVVLGMILTCRSKRWDRRDRRAKDARREREWRDEA